MPAFHRPSTSTKKLVGGGCPLVVEGREVPEHKCAGMSSEPWAPQFIYPDKEDYARLDGKTFRKDGHTSVALV